MTRQRGIKYCDVRLIDDLEDYYDAFPDLNLYAVDSGVEASGGQFACTKAQLDLITSALGTTGHGTLVLDSGNSDDEPIVLYQVAMLSAEPVFHHLRGTSAGKTFVPDLYIITLADAVRARSSRYGHATAKRRGMVGYDPREVATTDDSLTDWREALSDLISECYDETVAAASFPYAPDAKCHDFDSSGSDGLTSLLHAGLSRIFCRLTVDPTTNPPTMAVVRRSENDTTIRQELTSLITVSERHIAGGEYIVPAYARPQSVIVHFPVRYVRCDYQANQNPTTNERAYGINPLATGSSDDYTLTRTDPDTVGTGLPAHVHTYDIAIYDAEKAGYVNATDLGAIADEIRDEYYLRFQHSHFNYLYSGLLPYVPNKLIKTVVWSMRGMPTTQVMTDTGADETSGVTMSAGRGVQVIPEWGGRRIVTAAIPDNETRYFEISQLVTSGLYSAYPLKKMAVATCTGDGWILSTASPAIQIRQLVTPDPGIPSGSRVSAQRIYVWTSLSASGSIEWWTATPAAGGTFLVTVSGDGGAVGGTSGSCTWTYTAKDLQARTLGTTLTPKAARVANMAYIQASGGSYGLGAFSVSHDFILLQAYAEQIDSTDCD